MASKKRNRPATEAKAAGTSDATLAAPGLFDRPLYRHGAALLVLAVVSFGFFGPIHFSGKSLIAFDTVSWRAMAQSMIDYEAATGEQALWSTHPFGGMPGYLIAAPEGVPQADDLFSALRRVIWPSSHFLVMLAGAYVLGFMLTGGVWSALFAACAYGLTSYMPIILSAGHNSKFIALAFAPWLIVAFGYALRRPGLLQGLLFAIALAANLSAGHIQITYYAVWVIGIVWLVEGVRALRGEERAAFLRATGWLALGGVLAILMVANPYLAIAEYKEFTIRGAESGGAPGAMDWSYAMGWSQGVGELLTLLIADAYGGSSAYWGPKTFTGGPHYVGGLVLVFAALAVWRYRTPAVLGLAIAALVMTLFSLGEHFSILNRPMYDYFPLFGSFRVPETWLSMVALTLAALAAVGLHGVLGERDTTGSFWRSPAVVAFGVAIAFTAILMVGKESLMAFERPGEYAQIAQQIASGNNVAPNDPRVEQAARQYITEVGAQRRDMFGGDALRTLLFLVLGLGVVVAVRRGAVPAWVGGGVLVLLVVIDLWGVDRRYLNAEQLVDAKDSAEEVPLYDFDRFLVDRVAEAGGPGHFRVLSLEGRHPMVNARPSFHYESLGGYHGAKLRLYQDYLEHLLLNPVTGVPNPNALDLMGVRYVVSGRPIPGMTVVYTGDQTGYSVYEKTDALPRAYFVDETEVIDGHEAIWERLLSPGFDPGRTAIVEEAIVLAPAPIDSNTTATATLQRFSPHEIEWAVETDASRLLVVGEVYYPAGWTAAVDGVETPIHPVNYLVRGVEVPAGAHTVTMRFEPASVRTGRMISGIATFLVYGGVLALLGLGYFRRSR